MINQTSYEIIDEMKKLGFNTHYIETEPGHKFFFYKKLLDFAPFGEGETLDEAIFNAKNKALEFYS